MDESVVVLGATDIQRLNDFLAYTSERGELSSVTIKEGKINITVEVSTIDGKSITEWRAGSTPPVNIRDKY